MCFQLGSTGSLAAEKASVRSLEHIHHLRRSVTRRVQRSFPSFGITKSRRASGKKTGSLLFPTSYPPLPFSSAIPAPERKHDWSFTILFSASVDAFRDESLSFRLCSRLPEPNIVGFLGTSTGGEFPNGPLGCLFRFWIARAGRRAELATYGQFCSQLQSPDRKNGKQQVVCSVAAFLAPQKRAAKAGARCSLKPPPCSLRLCSECRIC